MVEAGGFCKSPTPASQNIAPIASRGERFSHKTQFSYPLGLSFEPNHPGKEIPMNVGPGHISPGTLELLQIRALRFHDTVDEFLAVLEKDQQDESMAEDSSVPLSVQES